MPQSSEHEPDDYHAVREFRRGEELTNGAEVCDTGNRQRNDEGGFTYTAELAGADRQRHKQDGAEPVEPVGWRELHKSPVPVCNCASACPHCFSQTAVRGALAGASRSSAASRVKSPSTSMS